MAETGALTTPEERDETSSPLATLAKYVAFSEGIVAAVAAFSEGWIQATFAALAVLVVVVSLGVFGLVLWSRPHHLYPPAHFRGGASIDDYIRAMGALNQASTQQVQEAVERQLRSKELRDALKADLSSAETELDEKLDETMKKAAERAAQTLYLEVSTQPLLGAGGSTVRIPYTDDMTANRLVSAFWPVVADDVSPYSYGREWVFRNVDTGTEYPLMGSAWALQGGGDVWEADTRPLSTIGITGGARLAVDRPSKKQDGSSPEHS